MTDEIIADDEFGRLEEAGITSSYVEIKDGHMKPSLTLATALELGFFPKGTKVIWNDRNGYDYERDRLRNIIDKGHTLTVEHCTIGSSSSYYEFEEIEGQWNTVMFDKT